MKTLDDARRLIREEARRLDPDSRYVRELLAIVDASSDVPDLERRLDGGGRGRFWAGDETFARMTLPQKLLVNLITNETSIMRFERPEIRFLRERVIPFLRGTAGRILSLPCSHGEEAVSVAIECVEAGLADFFVQGYDVQPACIETARRGRIPLSGMPRYVVGLVDPAILKHLRFDVADVFKDELSGVYDFAVCRNFLGYFRPDVAREILRTFVRLLAEGAYFMVEPFILSKHPEIFEGLPLSRCGDLPFFARGA